MSVLPARVDVVVVGAGLAGLAAARHLHNKSFNVAVLEAQDDVDRKSTRLNSSHVSESRMPSSA